MLVADLAGSTEAVVGQFLVAFPESLRRLIEHLYSLLEMEGPSGNSSPPSALRGDEEFTVLSTADEVRHSNKPAVFLFFLMFFLPFFLVISSLPSPKSSLVAEPSHTWLAAAGFVVLKF